MELTLDELCHLLKALNTHLVHQITMDEDKTSELFVKIRNHLAEERVEKGWRQSRDVEEDMKAYGVPISKSEEFG